VENHKVLEVHRNLFAVHFHVDLSELWFLAFPDDFLLVDSDKVSHISIPSFPVIRSFILFTLVSSIQTHLQLNLPVQELFFLFNSIKHLLFHPSDLHLCVFLCFVLLLLFHFFDYRLVHQMLCRHLFFARLRVYHFGKLVLERVKKDEFRRTVVWLYYDNHRVWAIFFDLILFEVGLVFLFLGWRFNSLSLLDQVFGFKVVNILSSPYFLDVVDDVRIHFNILTRDLLLIFFFKFVNSLVHF